MLIVAKMGYLSYHLDVSSRDDIYSSMFYSSGAIEKQGRALPLAPAFKCNPVKKTDQLTN